MEKSISSKSRVVALLLCLLVGWLGAHRFYAGKIGSGILMILIGWLTLGIWWLVDLIMIIVGSFSDSDGNPIVKWLD